MVQTLSHPDHFKTSVPSAREGLTLTRLPERGITSFAPIAIYLLDRLGRVQGSSMQPEVLMVKVT